MPIAGFVLVGVALLAPLYWFVPLMGQYDGIALFSQYIGSTALVSMAMSQFLATRARWQQLLFGGLDQIYWLHKWLGIFGITAILLHDTVDAEVRGFGAETFLTDFAETLGELCLYGLLILVVITIATYIPYHIWRWTHKLMGAFFVAASLHYFFILKPFSNFDPLGFYVGGFCVLGIFSYFYSLLPFDRLQGRHPYRVASIDNTGGAVSVALDPEKKGLVHRAGQFAFIRFEGRGRNEVHPFTISKAPDEERTLRFTFKPLGDDTRTLASQLEAGDRVRVSPAYGHFTRRGNRPEVWIAGGIGVTPFAAFAQELDETSPPVHFFYCVSEAANAAHLQDFQNLAQRLPSFHFHLIESKDGGRLTEERIEGLLDEALSEVMVYYCGPKSLRMAMQKGFAAAGLNMRRFRYEEFEIRSGIMISPLVNFALRLVAKVAGETTLGARFKSQI